jgi:hypothetical protein
MRLRWRSSARETAAMREWNGPSAGALPSLWPDSSGRCGMGAAARSMCMEFLLVYF